jgi:CRISPR/Cas system CSM-associated protein Csm2 small subunit
MASDDSEGPSLLDIGSDVEDPAEELDAANGEILSFTDEEDESLALHKVRRAVRKYGEDGISVAELEEATELTRKTIRKHLDTLRRLREVYRQKKNKQLHLYYPNGRPLHSYGKKRIEVDDTILDIQLAEGKDEGYYFHVTEKRYSLMEGETTEGAIIFPKSAFDEFVTKLNEFAAEVEE